MEVARRFFGGRRAGKSQLPVVYTDMDGGGTSNSGSRRISLAVGGNNRVRESRGFHRIYRYFLSFFESVNRNRSFLRSSARLGSANIDFGWGGGVIFGEECGETLQFVKYRHMGRTWREHEWNSQDHDGHISNGTRLNATCILYQN